MPNLLTKSRAITVRNIRPPLLPRDALLRCPSCGELPACPESQGVPACRRETAGLLAAMCVLAAVALVGLALVLA